MLDPNMTLDEAVPKESKYLQKTDVGEVGKNLKIAAVDRVELDIDANNSETKTVLIWTESDVKPMVLNQTNKNRLARILNAHTVGDLIGKEVNVFNDPDVEFGGRVTGGLRIRAAVTESKTPPAQPQLDDDVPF